MAEDGKPHDGQFRGTRNLRRLADISDRKQREAVERGLELGLEPGPARLDGHGGRAFVQPEFPARLEVEVLDRVREVDGLALEAGIGERAIE